MERVGPDSAVTDSRSSEVGVVVMAAAVVADSPSQKIVVAVLEAAQKWAKQQAQFRLGLVLHLRGTEDMSR